MATDAWWNRYTTFTEQRPNKERTYETANATHTAVGQRQSEEQLHSTRFWAEAVGDQQARQRISTITSTLLQQKQWSDLDTTSKQEMGLTPRRGITRLGPEAPRRQAETRGKMPFRSNCITFLANSRTTGSRTYSRGSLTDGPSKFTTSFVSWKRSYQSRFGRVLAFFLLPPLPSPRSFIKR